MHLRCCLMLYTNAMQYLSAFRQHSHALLAHALTKVVIALITLALADTVSSQAPCIRIVTVMIMPMFLQLVALTKHLLGLSGLVEAERHTYMTLLQIRYTTLYSNILSLVSIASLAAASTFTATSCCLIHLSPAVLQLHTLHLEHCI
jgi:hypothetical protein